MRWCTGYTKSMDTLGEKTLKSVVVFTALRLEMGWRMKPVTSKALRAFGLKKENILESAVDEMQLIN